MVSYRFTLLLHILATHLSTLKVIPHDVEGEVATLLSFRMTSYSTAQKHLHMKWIWYTETNEIVVKWREEE